MKNQVLNNEKILRSRSLHKLSDSMRYNFYKSNIGKVKKVLFETEVEDGYVIGFSENYIRVKVKGDKKMLSKIFNVKLLFIENDKNHWRNILIDKPFIGIAGNIGVGKTTFTKILSKEIEFNSIL